MRRLLAGGGSEACRQAGEAGPCFHSSLLPSDKQQVLSNGLQMISMVRQVKAVYDSQLCH